MVYLFVPTVIKIAEFVENMTKTCAFFFLGHCCSSAWRLKRVVFVERAYFCHFTALHWMHGGLVTNLVCPSVYRTRRLWQKGRKIYPDFYTISKII